MPLISLSFLDVYAFFKGLDALAQAITCDGIVGWRSGVRRVIIFVTDDEPHLALDGKMVHRVTRETLKRGKSQYR
jgi:hypothetical protein